MEFVYPAIIRVKDDGTCLYSFPDFPGCSGERPTLVAALREAGREVTAKVDFLVENNQPVPDATKREDVRTGPEEFVNMIVAVINPGFTRRNLGMPKWMDEAFLKANTGLSFSAVLQEAVLTKLPPEVIAKHS